MWPTDRQTVTSSFKETLLFENNNWILKFGSIYQKKFQFLIFVIVTELLWQKLPHQDKNCGRCFDLALWTWLQLYWQQMSLVYALHIWHANSSHYLKVHWFQILAKLSSSVTHSCYSPISTCNRTDHTEYVPSQNYCLEFQLLNIVNIFCRLWYLLISLLSWKRHVFPETSTKSGLF